MHNTAISFLGNFHAFALLNHFIVPIGSHLSPKMTITIIPNIGKATFKFLMNIIYPKIQIFFLFNVLIINLILGEEFEIDGVTPKTTIKEIKERMQKEWREWNDKWRCQYLEVFSGFIELTDDLKVTDCLTENKVLGLFYPDEDPELLAQMAKFKSNLKNNDVFITFGHRSGFVLPIKLSEAEFTRQKVSSKKVGIVEKENGVPVRVHRFELPKDVKRGQEVEIMLDKQGENWSLSRIIEDGAKAIPVPLLKVDTVPFKQIGTNEQLDWIKDAKNVAKIVFYTAKLGDYLAEILK